MSSSWVRVTSGRQRHPHALHERPAARRTRPGLRYGHGSRDAIIFSGRSSSWVTWPLGQCRRSTGRTGSQTLRSRARTSAGLRICASTRASSSASCGLIWRDAPVRGQRLQPQVLGAQVEPAGQLDGAHDGVDRQLGTDQLGLGGQERVVERRRCGRPACGPRSTSISSSTTSAKDGWPSSISAVRPCTWVGPGSTPGLSRVEKLCSTLPSSPTARAATLTMRA